VLKADDGLSDSIFKNLKVFFLQVEYQLVAFQHRRIQHHLLHVGVQNVAAVLPDDLRHGEAFGVG